MKAKVWLVVIAVAVIFVGCVDTPPPTGSKSKQPPVAVAENTAPTPAVPARPIAAPVVPETSPAPETLPELAYWDDGSVSLREAERKMVTRSILHGLRNGSAMIRGVRVTRFSRGDSEIWAETGKEYAWGAPPMIGPGNISQLPLEARIFTQARQQLEEEASSNGQDALRQRIAEYERSVDEQLKLIESELMPASKEPAPCTRLTDLAVRIADEDRPLALIVTDGWNDCKDRVEIDRRTSGRILIVIVRRSFDKGAENATFDQRKAEMRKLFPSAEIVPPYLAEKALMTMLMNADAGAVARLKG